MATLKARLDALEVRPRTKTVYEMTDDELLDGLGYPRDISDAELCERMTKARKARQEKSHAAES